jgi:hypothetical protein
MDTSWTAIRRWVRRLVPYTPFTVRGSPFAVHRSLFTFHPRMHPEGCHPHMHPEGCHPHMHPEGCHAFMAEGRYPLAGHAFIAFWPFTHSLIHSFTLHRR